MKYDKNSLSPGGVEVNIMPVVQGDSLVHFDPDQLPEVVPVLALRNAVLFPGTVYPVTIGREKSIRLIREVESRDGFLGAVPQTDVSVEEPLQKDLSRYGTVAKVIKTIEMPDGSMTAILQGIRRLELGDILQYDPYIVARVHYLEDTVPDMDDNQLLILMDSLKEKAAQIVRSSSFAPKEFLPTKIACEYCSLSRVPFEISTSSSNARSRCDRPSSWG